ncbi:MAG: RDD family protein [Planctomycetota bacterium]
MASGSATLRITSPEGVPLHFRPASAGDRIGAFILDCLFFGFGVAIPLIVLTLFTIWGGQEAIAGALANSLWLLFPLYFIVFEIRGHGRSPGKRIIGIRTIDLAGRTLSNSAIFTRNLTRFFETILPVLVLRYPFAFFPTFPFWAVLLCLGWFAVLLFLPLMNKRRQRIGDFMANTIVVQAPRSTLLRDLTTSKRSQSDSKAGAPAFRYTFTTEELELYGIFELQRLEGLLRTKDTKIETLMKVRDVILKKMARTESVRGIQTRRFLQDLYAQLRRHLEQKMLFGTRQERKKKGRLTRTPKSE